MAEPRRSSSGPHTSTPVDRTRRSDRQETEAHSRLTGGLAAWLSEVTDRPPALDPPAACGADHLILVDAHSVRDDSTVAILDVEPVGADGCPVWGVWIGRNHHVGREMTVGWPAHSLLDPLG